MFSIEFETEEAAREYLASLGFFETMSGDGDLLWVGGGWNDKCVLEPSGLGWTVTTRVRQRGMVRNRPAGPLESR